MLQKFIVIPVDQSDKENVICDFVVNEFGIYFYNYELKDNLQHFKMSNKTYLNLLKEMYSKNNIYWEQHNDNWLLIIESNLEELQSKTTTALTLLSLQS